ncbi:Clavaminate synthase-like protein [Metschnikowia bicuspidata var. bicuspidata NRRL YB-4993]|uniref:Clavaminate synthase-like protein n=1 Tax=Metschnikowia bicuspidata var. bicuspidata NRRL YB-4993 TaxID=869754 RepID=A0A1A0HIL3_9ASCO|nr:Clavaminate synthase-like protein [Metschnikowia bicuspidata var. bicuspidata NRRL YB-4993]OBA23994.1 Clavaminate synthase-like protein [Metschnikowia bicuspidata var. bicuspidata NRRL YB-4993]
MKRSAEEISPGSKSQRSNNEYRGYTVNDADTVLSVSDVGSFRLQFIDARKPVKLTCGAPISIGKFRLESILDTLQYELPLQVERKVKYGFGLGRTREHLQLRDIVHKLRLGDDSYYLTTQYDEEEDSSFAQLGDGAASNSDLLQHSAQGNAGASSDDDSIDMSNLHDDFDAGASSDSGAESDPNTDDMDAEDADFRVRSLFQPPLTNLVHDESFPIAPAPFQNLIPQQINLWMGAAATGTAKPDLLNPSAESLGRYLPRGNSSGLHHDHADNLYVLVQGRKRFTLYLPNDAAKLYTVGDIHRIYGNGLIDYHVNENARFWRPMREDGAIQAEWARWALENNITCGHTSAQLTAMIENEPTCAANAETRLDPPSFSRVPPILAHLDEVPDAAERRALQEYADREFPGFRHLGKLEVWLEPGEMLYVPTGWFHEVTSFASEAGAAHVALNWWFMPPSREGENPYDDDYWAADFETTQMALSMTREAAL